LLRLEGALICLGGALTTFLINDVPKNFLSTRAPPGYPYDQQNVIQSADISLFHHGPTGGGTIGMASYLRGFESCLGTITQWPSTSYLHPCASVTKQYNLLPAKGRWRPEAGKVTIGLAMHWPCVTDFVVYPPTGSRPT